MRHPSYKYARAAYRYGPSAYKYGSKIARFLYRRYKSRKRSPAKKARIGIGEAVGSSSSKQALQSRDIGFQALASRTLMIDNLTGTDQGTANNRQDRQNTIINCRGFKVCMAVRNNIGNAPVYYNVALVSPKNSGAITTDNFFRGQGNASRGLAFDNSRTALEFHCLPLNTDNKYILKHKRYRLAPENGGNQQYNNQRSNSYMNINWYVKLKRQLRYDDADSNFPIDGSVYLVQWCDTFDAASGSASAPSTVQIMQRHIMYFRESKLCC
jgi:hypothetical protein